MPKNNKPFRLVAHRRSGNHFLWQALSRNFGIKEVGGFKYHRPYKYAAKKIIETYNCIYLVRDLRDTLIASWHYWMNPRAEPSMNVRPLLKDKSISDYIRGVSDEELKKAGFARKSKVQKNVYDHLHDPVQHWVDYTEWSDILYTIRFEDFKNNQEGTIRKFGKYFGLSFVKNRFKPVNKLVGLFPRKGKIGEWRDTLTKEDKEYIVSKAENALLKFGYEI